MLNQNECLLLVIDLQEKLVKMVGENNPVATNCEKLLNKYMENFFYL